MDYLFLTVVRNQTEHIGHKSDAGLWKNILEFPAESGFCPSPEQRAAYLYLAHALAQLR